MSNSPIVHDRFLRLCRRYGIAATYQRQVVWESVISSTDHPTPELIYERVRPLIRSISLATVYKCLHKFLEMGLIKEANRHHGPVRIDPNIRHHDHAFCRVCGQLSDLEALEIPSLSLSPKSLKGFHVEKTEIEFVGTCAQCHANRSEKPRGNSEISRSKTGC